MSETVQTSAGGDIRERLRKAAVFQPRGLPRLVELAESWAGNAAARLCEIAAEPLTFVYKDMEIEGLPHGASAEDQASEAPAATGLHAPLSSRRLARPGWIAVEPDGVELLIAAFFGAELQSDPRSRAPSKLDRSLVQLFYRTVAKTATVALAELGELPLSVGDLRGPGGLREEEEEEDKTPPSFVVFRFEVAVEGLVVPLSVALPESYFMPHRRHLAMRPALRQLDRDEAWSQAIEANFAMSDMRLEVILARKQVSLAMLAGLEVGQSIPLDVGALDLVAVECESQALFNARIGRSRESYVVKIESRIDPAEEFIGGILPH